MSTAGYLGAYLSAPIASGFLNAQVEDFTYLSGSQYLAIFVDSGLTTEMTGGSYARQIITFSTQSGNAAHNTNTITFSAVPAATVYGWGIFDAVTGGSPYVYWTNTVSDVNTILPTSDGDTVVVNPSTITIQF